MIATHDRLSLRMPQPTSDSSDGSDGKSFGGADIAEAELREALRLARGACELLDRAAPASGPRGHSIRIAQAISESLVIELEMVTGKGSMRAKRIT
jgi:hypothetical protein